MAYDFSPNTTMQIYGPPPQTAQQGVLSGNDMANIYAKYGTKMGDEYIKEYTKAGTQYGTPEHAALRSRYEAKMQSIQSEEAIKNAAKTKTEGSKNGAKYSAFYDKVYDRTTGTLNSIYKNDPRRLENVASEYGIPADEYQRLFPDKAVTNPNLIAPEKLNQWKGGRTEASPENTQAKIKQALDAGYSIEEIYGHLGLPMPEQVEVPGVKWTRSYQDKQGNKLRTPERMPSEYGYIEVPVSDKNMGVEATSGTPYQYRFRG